jgi:ketosteroid isomerase-like protein
MRFPIKLCLPLAILSFSALADGSQPLMRDNPFIETSDSIAVEKTAERFIDAFINLDWNRFRSFFAADATVFFPPSAKYSRRANGKAEIESLFMSVFERAHKQRSGPPYLSIRPKELKIQMLGDVAIVTFHMEDPDSFGRRTIVFQRHGEQWLIVHLHASAIMVNAASCWPSMDCGLQRGLFHRATRANSLLRNRPSL